MPEHDGHTVSVPSARQLALEAMAAADWGFETIPLRGLGNALDAIPAHVLAHLALERGGLEACGWRWRETLFGSWVVHHWKPEGYDALTSPAPVYRITEEPDA